MMNTTEEFRLLVAAIADEERLPWPEAERRAKLVWNDLEHDPTAPAPQPARDWRFTAWLLGLLLLISLIANVALIALIALAQH